MLIIYISGIDGCGKTTQSKLLANILKKRGFDVEYRWLRWEPSVRKLLKLLQSLVTSGEAKDSTDQTEIENIGHDAWNSFKRKILSSYFLRHLWWLHACADYYHKTRKELWNINAKIVVIDRYVLDFMIDQGCNMGITPENILKLSNNFFLKRFKLPDLTIIIDLPAIEGYVRKKDGTPLNYMKERELYYKSIPVSNNTVHFDGFQDINLLAERIENWILHKLPKIFM